MRATVETASLRFRPVRADDADALFEFQSADPYWRHFPYDDLSREALAKRIGMSLANPDAGGAFIFCVAELKPGNTLVGEATLAAIGPRVAVIGWGVDPNYWRKGLGSETARMLLEVGFLDMNLHRIQAQASVDNAGSIRIMAKLGMTCERVRRQCMHARDRWWSMKEYALLRTDYVRAAVSASPTKAATQAAATILAS